MSSRTEAPPSPNKERSRSMRLGLACLSCPFSLSPARSLLLMGPRHSRRERNGTGIPLGHSEQGDLVRIGDAETGQHLALECLHFLRLRVGFVIVAEQMQKAMHDEMREMRRKALVFRRRLARHCLEGDGYITENNRIARPRCRRKREHVGRLVLT